MAGHVKALLLPWLDARSMTQRDLAKQLGITEQAVCMFLSNRANEFGSIRAFNPMHCRKIAKALKLNAEDTRRLHLAAAADKGYRVLP